MKKYLLIILAALISATVVAQNREMLFQEFFDGSSMPMGWTVTGLGTSNWSISATNNAGGNPNELMLNWEPSFEGVSRMVFPAIDLTGVAGVTFSFKHYLDNFHNPSDLGVATSSDGGVTWNECWRESFSTTGIYMKSLDIVNDDMGKPNVQFCIFYEGNSISMNYWYFDDISIYTNTNFDLGINVINVPEHIACGDHSIGMQVTNYGITEITSIEASYQVDNQEPIIEVFNLNIPSLETAMLDFAAPANFMPGQSVVKMELLQVNGTHDDDASDDVLEKEINVSLGFAERIPMIEHFSASTCYPCVQVNTAMNEFCAAHPDKFTYVKYVTDFPYPGDPYFTQEGYARQYHYNVTGVPQVFFDGAETVAATPNEDEFSSHHNMMAPFDIRGAFHSEGSMIYVSLDVMPYADMDGLTVYVSVNEKTTTGNVGTNGETEFHHVLMKMLPNADGTPMTFRAGEKEHLNFNYDMTATFVEEMNDLEVAVWIEDYAAHYIYNSHFLYETENYPYPVENLILTENESGEENLMSVSWDMPADGNPVGYNVFVNGNLVAAQITETEYTFASDFGRFYIVEVQAVYDNDNTSVKQLVTKINTWSVTENTDDEIRLFPNPTQGFVSVQATATIQNAAVFDMLGNLINTVKVNGKTFEMDFTGFNNGMYFIKLQAADGKSQVCRVVVTH
ncbi:MAG: T9SS type A sorting domain-containing protein [bacterium]|nr:T9SS type A sorting domain-containing protein [Candidatus Limimorpha equi]